MSESRFIERKVELPPTLIERAEASHPGPGFKNEADWLRCVKEDFVRFIPFLTERCSLEFRGRILEIGAGAAWFSAEISKLPQVVEVIATDVSARLLKGQATKVFKLLKAHEGKITRMPADFGRLGFRNNHFDAVICADALHRAVNVRRVLREVRRVLKPGGVFIAIREPVRPAARHAQPGYAVSEYRDFFEQAGLKLEIKRVVLSRGVKYYFDKAVNGFTHARYAFVATKAGH